MTKASLNLRTILKDDEQGWKLVPALRSLLFDPHFKAFSVDAEDFDGREPDGLFHSSTHPTWPERMLYYYIAEPERLVQEVFEPSSTMAVTVGKFWHRFLGTVLLRAGHLNALEVPVLDEVAGRTGAMDGTADWGVYELKTMRASKMKRMVDLATYQELCPEYYAQGQDYMDMSGFREHRTVIVVPEYPFPMQEIVMPYDPIFAGRIRDKYMRVRQAVADQQLPHPCCAPGSAMAKQCPARTVCPVGLA